MKKEYFKPSMKVVKLDGGIVKNVVEPTRILNTWFRILTAKKAASANRFKRNHLCLTKIILLTNPLNQS